MTNTIYDRRNISMMMDLYELTMANGFSAPFCYKSQPAQ